MRATGYSGVRLAFVAIAFAMVGCDTGRGTEPPVAAAPAAEYSSQDIFKGVIFGTGPVGTLFPELHAKADATRLGSPAYRQRVASDLDRAAGDFEQLGKTVAAGKARALAAEVRSAPAAMNTQIAASLEGQGMPLPDPVEVDQLMTDLSAEDATFVDRFAAAARSGNQVQIRDALHEAARVLFNLAAIQLEQGGGPGHAPTVSPGLALCESFEIQIQPSQSTDPSISVGTNLNADLNTGISVNINIWLQDNVAVANNAVIFQSSFLFSSVLSDQPGSNDPLVEDTAVNFIAERLHA